MRTIYNVHKWLLARWARANFRPWWPGRVLLVALSPLIRWHQGWMEREKARRAEYSAKRFALRTRHWQRSKEDDT
jgi:hypothetical protein